MTSLRNLACLLFVSCWAVALAAPNTPVIIQPHGAQHADSTLKLQTSEGAACSTPTVGNCGSCSVSCSTGQSAQCKPGIAVGPQSGASCVTSPECKCQ